MPEVAAGGGGVRDKRNTITGAVAISAASNTWNLRKADVRLCYE